MNRSMHATILSLFIILCSEGAVIRAQQPPQKCCLKPDMCSFFTASLIGYVQESDRAYGSYPQTVGIVADFPNSRFALNITTTLNGNTSNAIIIEKYKENLQWVIDPLAKTCHVMAIPEDRMIERCIPDEAQFSGQVTFAGDRLCNVWTFPLKTKSLDGMFTSTVTADECIPVTSSYTGTDSQGGSKTYVVEGTGYYDFKSLNDVSKYFVLPPYCQKIEDPLFTMKRKVSNEVKRIKQIRRFL
ncbi:ependymin-related protein 2-like [Anneissia japonica]|uniref:ependymin-related protein 2-like n=1 Tax=Anneissia japonica TaxID=1529436 RepID=UPI0014259D63|nr:ependymin-related protein 2-like [Anneissia japonica]